MNTNVLWDLFMETGAPEMYLLYTKQQKMEAKHVFDGQGNRPQGNGL